MNNWEKEIRQKSIDFDSFLEKSKSHDVLELNELKSFLKSNNMIIETFDDISKGQKDTSKLIKKEVWVSRGGKRYKQTVYVKPDDIEGKTQPTPVGEELSPTVSGMNITRYSDKAILVSGETKSNVETLREIKSSTGVGSWNRKLNGWVFPLSYLDTVLGTIWSKFKNNGEDEKAQAIQNQKNASLSPGDKAEMKGGEITITKNSSDSEGSKYDATTKEGVELKGVDEKTLEVRPEKNDKKISEIINGASPENRVRSEKQIYGISPVKDIQNYSLSEYMSMHGISQQDIDLALDRLKTKKYNGKKSTGGRTSSPKPESSEPKELTKRQLIGKLVYAHYQAVRNAVKEGGDLLPEVLATYPDLKSEYDKKRQAMSEETKRKISEALKKNRVPENENSIIKKENSEAEEVNGVKDINKENYQPEIENLTVKFGSGGEGDFKVKNFTDIPALDIIVPKQKNILKIPKPYFIPDVDESQFSSNGYQFSSYKLSDDKYLVALGGYHRDVTEKLRYTQGRTVQVKINNDFAYMSLDQLAATESYYRAKAKQVQKEEDDKRVENYKNDLISRGESEKEAAEKAKRRISRSRIKVTPDNKSSYSNFRLYDDINYTTNGTSLSRIEEWEIHREIRGDIRQKRIDLDLQQEYSDTAYTKGAKTSYGDSNLKDTLLGEYGVKIKRQNGDEISGAETLQIKNALDSVSEAFGKNPKMNQDFGLKVSHSGDVLMHARKAVGLFHPAYNAIGVSAKHGSVQFNMTFAHEYGHFMDYWIGKNTGNHYASDKWGGTANKIASTLRTNMNEAQSSSYYNNTKECFARSLEQYYAIEVLKNKEVYEDPIQVNETVYKEKLKPLVEQFLKENKDILKSSLFSDFYKS